MNKKSIICIVLAVAWIGVIWGHSLQPAVVSDGESLGLLAILNSFLPFELTNHIVRKAAHFTEYMILGLLILNVHRSLAEVNPRQLRASLVLSFAVAFIDETIQLFVEGRSGQISDVWLDFAGACTGVLVLYIIMTINKRRAR